MYNEQWVERGLRIRAGYVSYEWRVLKHEADLGQAAFFHLPPPRISITDKRPVAD